MWIPQCGIYFAKKRRNKKIHFDWKSIDGYTKIPFIERYQVVTESVVQTL